MPNTIHIGHSPDSDDAFMFYALATGKLDTGEERYEHHLEDIETLNRKAERGVYDVTAVSFHAYAYVASRYVLLAHGASLGDGYGPVLVARDYADEEPRSWLRGKSIAVPGLRTSAFLALSLFARGLGESTPGAQPPAPFVPDLVPFDRILEVVAAGRCDAGLLIHEGQLTYSDAASGRLKKVVDLGAWWRVETGLPLPLGGNVIRRDLGPECIARVSRHLRESIAWGLAHREEALTHAMQHARGLDRPRADRFVGLYVNHYTLNYGEAGRAAVRRFLDEGWRAGLLPEPVQPEWEDERAE